MMLSSILSWWCDCFQSGLSVRKHCSVYHHMGTYCDMQWEYGIMVICGCPSTPGSVLLCLHVAKKIRSFLSSTRWFLSFSSEYLWDMEPVVMWSLQDLSTLCSKCRVIGVCGWTNASSSLKGQCKQLQLPTLVLRVRSFLTVEVTYSCCGLLT